MARTASDSRGSYSRLSKSGESSEDEEDGDCVHGHHFLCFSCQEPEEFDVDTETQKLENVNVFQLIFSFQTSTLASDTTLCRGFIDDLEGLIEARRRAINKWTFWTGVTRLSEFMLAHGHHFGELKENDGHTSSTKDSGDFQSSLDYKLSSHFGRHVERHIRDSANAVMQPPFYVPLSTEHYSEVKNFLEVLKKTWGDTEFVKELENARKKLGTARSCAHQKPVQGEDSGTETPKEWDQTALKKKTLAELVGGKRNLKTFLGKDEHGKDLYPPAWWNSVLLKACWLGLTDLVREGHLTEVWHIATRLSNEGWDKKTEKCSEHTDMPLAWARLPPLLFDASLNLLPSPNDRSLLDFNSVMEDVWTRALPDYLLRTRRYYAQLENVLARVKRVQAQVVGGCLALVTSTQFLFPLLKWFYAQQLQTPVNNVLHLNITVQP